MVPGKIIITGMIIVAAFAGCTKKKPGGRELASSGQTAATSTPAASQDIFDEFYKADSSVATKSESNATKKEPVVRAASGGAPEFVDGGRYVVQVATHPSQRLADRTSAKLSAKGYPAYVAEVQNPTPALTGTFYRVRIGGFTGIASARSFGEQYLVPEGYEYWVDNRSNDNVGVSSSGLGSGSSSYYGSEPQPASDYQSSYQSSYQSTPAPEPVPAAASTPAPEPAPAPAATTPAKAPVSGETAPSEWGNDGW